MWLLHTRLSTSLILVEVNQWCPRSGRLSSANRHVAALTIQPSSSFTQEFRSLVSGNNCSRGFMKSEELTDKPDFFVFPPWQAMCCMSQLKCNNLCLYPGLFSSSIEAPRSEQLCECPCTRALILMSGEHELHALSKEWRGVQPSEYTVKGCKSREAAGLWGLDLITDWGFQFTSHDRVFWTCHRDLVFLRSVLSWSHSPSFLWASPFS